MTTRISHPVAVRPARIAGRTWRGWTALILAGISPATGCYQTLPVSSAPEPGTTVLLDLNDRGRFQLGDRIGPAASRIEGIVQQQNDTAYMVRISSVQYLNGQSNKWSGEPFTVPTAFVSGAHRRELSRSRTLLVSAGIAAAITSVFLKTNFFGSGTTTKEPPPPPTGGT